VRCVCRLKSGYYWEFTSYRVKSFCSESAGRVK
jgi:hypothetical protein